MSAGTDYSFESASGIGLTYVRLRVRADAVWVGQSAQVGKGAYSVPMTYDLAVWEGDRPDESMAGQTFRALYERYIDREDRTPVPPTSAIKAYVEALLDRWYELGDPRDVDDTSPWSDAPLMNNAQGPIIYFAMRYSMADEVSAACARMAADRGLVCFDVQWDQLRPTADEP